MTKQEKNDLMLEAFEILINQHCLWFDYFYWFDKCRCNGECQEMYTLWKNWANSKPPQMWSSQAFIWESTDIAYQLWYEIDKDWRGWLAANLNN